MPDLSCKLTHAAASNSIRLLRDSETRDVIAEVNAEHEALCRQIAACASAARSDGGGRALAVAQLVEALELHMRVEEEVLFPALAREPSLHDALQVAEVEHRLIRELVRELSADDPGAVECRATIAVLGKIVRHHVEEEAYGLLPRVRQTGLDLELLGRAVRDRRRELTGGDVRSGLAASRLPQPRASRAR